MSRVSGTARLWLLTMAVGLGLAVASCGTHVPPPPPPPPPAPPTAAAPPPPERPPAARRAAAATTLPEGSQAVVPVFYATDRARGESADVAYSSRRNAAGTLALGRFDVSIPRDHRSAHLERPNLWSFYVEVTAKHFRILQRTELTGDAFYTDLHRVVDASARKETVVFVHGYNTTFDDAIYRTAQLSYDLGIDGASVCYSWPSQGELVDYVTDLNNNRWTVDHLRWFLEDLAAKSGAERIHLIAHSMGNQALTAALSQLAQATSPLPRPHFNQLVLAAPDIDVDVFRQLASDFTRTADRTTLYASSHDEALLASMKIQGGYRRAGDAGAGVVVVPHVDSVDVSALDTGLLGHSYYGDATSVVTDLVRLIEAGLQPADRGLQPVGMPAQYWIFRR